MKKTLSLVLACLMVLSLTACGQQPQEKQLEGTLTDIMKQVYADSGLPFANDVTLMENELKADNLEAYLGTKDVDFEEGLVSEPMINAIPHLLVLVRVKDGADVNAIMSDIQESANPWRWVCVGVDDSDVQVESIGNLVLLVMADDSEQYVEAFRGLAK